MASDAVIVSACRTPIGSFMGSLSPVSAPKLGALVVEEAVRRAGVAKSEIQEVIMGNVLPAGLGQAPARQAALFAGLPDSVECLTINKMCGSGLKAVMLGAQAIQLGDSNAIVAGGMESMSNAPYLLQKARDGYRMGDGKIIDSMIRDGLWDVYNDFHMGNAAEICAKECAIPRESQDEYAILSYKRAQSACSEGRFAEEILPVTIKGKQGDTILAQDEEPFKTNFEKVPKLKPAFQPDGTVTAANASKVNDGAAALTIMSSSKASALGIQPIARIVGFVSSAKKPEWFTTAPADAIAKVLSKCRMKPDDIDLYEINEAFAVVSLAVQKLVGIQTDRLNVNGGAVALGHPIGASGARILVTLLHALRQRKKSLGLAAICIGGGEASAMVIEVLS
ncbi:MAG TPA: thiolase family protein [Bacteroidota bacterium]|nr:thiolase family protein [Bacteroidota bacterium]